MTDSPLAYALDDGIARLTMDDGKANALGPAMLDALGAALERAESEAKAVVLVGRPEKFCAGFDLGVMQSGPKEGVALVAAGGDLLMRLYEFPLPVVAACTGHALAAGAMLLLASDIRVGAAGRFKIGLNETAIGIPLPVLARELARDRIAPNHLFEATLQAHLYDPGSAARVGFLDRVEPVGKLIETCETIARGLTKLDPRAYALSKRAMRRGTAEKVRGEMMAELEALFPA